MGVTIKDVARETNLAISTISKYMNGGRVRKKNQEAIEAAIRKLNYSPNGMARGLRTSRTYRVGLMTGNGDNPHASALLDEVEKKMREKGYSLIFMNNDECNQELSKEYIDYLVETGVDGIIATATGNQIDYLQPARDAKLPVVVMEECYTKVETDCVQVDCVGGAREIVEHLIEAGHKKIAVISGSAESHTAMERDKGYLRALEDYNIPVNKEYMIKGDYRHEAGYAGIKKLWQIQDRPTAVFVTNYNMCMGAMEAIYELGIKVPEELSIVSFDDFELSVMVRPKLTAVRQPLTEMADTACELLLRRMNGDFEDYPRRIRLKPECVYRDSVLQMRGLSGDYAKKRYNKKTDRDSGMVEKGL